MRRLTRLPLRGQGLVEYALLLLLIGTAVVLGVSLTGVSLTDVYNDALDDFRLGYSSEACAPLAQAGEGWQALKDKFWMGGITGADGAYEVCPLCGGLLPNNFGSDYSVALNGVGVKNVRSTWNGYGIAFRSSFDKNGLNGYMFEIEQVNKNQPVTAYFSKWVNGKQIRPPLSSLNLSSSFDWGNPPDFRIDSQGDSFTAYLDGAPVLSAKDSTYTDGSVGVISNQGTQLTFEDLFVTDLNCEETAP